MNEVWCTVEYQEIHTHRMHTIQFWLVFVLFESVIIHLYLFLFSHLCHFLLYVQPPYVLYVSGLSKWFMCTYCTDKAATYDVLHGVYSTIRWNGTPETHVLSLHRTVFCLYARLYVVSITQTHSRYAEQRAHLYMCRLGFTAPLLNTQHRYVDVPKTFNSFVLSTTCFNMQ